MCGFSYRWLFPRLGRAAGAKYCSLTAVEWSLLASQTPDLFFPHSRAKPHVSFRIIVIYSCLYALCGSWIVSMTIKYK